MATFPGISPSVSASVKCDFCHHHTSDAMLLHFTRVHSYGRHKYICQACRQRSVAFLKGGRVRCKKTAQSVQLANAMYVMCPCGKTRVLAWSTLSRYACACCYPFLPCLGCARYVVLPPKMTASATRTWNALVDKHTKYLPVEVRTEINHESVLIFLATDALYEVLKQDTTLPLYAKDVTIHCICPLCGGIHCCSSMVFTSTLPNFICTKCVFLYALEGKEPVPVVEKFMVMIVHEGHVSAILSHLTKHTTLHGGDAIGILTQFSLGDPAVGTVWLTKGADQTLLGMPFLK